MTCKSSICHIEHPSAFVYSMMGDALCRTDLPLAAETCMLWYLMLH